MGERTAKPKRKQRVDLLRNRERLIKAAKLVFAAGGPEATLETVSRSAGVGIGTLYRHFPTRGALFEAIYRTEVNELSMLAEQLAQTEAAAHALRYWLHANVKLIGTKKGMRAALTIAANSPSAAHTTHSFDRLTAAARLLLSRAVADGALRDRISAEDLMRAVIGMCSMRAQPGWRQTVTRLVDVFVDGLSVTVAAPAKARPAGKIRRPTVNGKVRTAGASTTRK